MANRDADGGTKGQQDRDPANDGENICRLSNRLGQFAG
ncbi:hypothetical protein chiPu_0028997, partial [Chiloscyllium punctatum]|nr:hypothetical protein [Chiloscyllium punctatum]